MLVPQAIHTLNMGPYPDALDVNPGAYHVPNLGILTTKDFEGKPVPMGELLRASESALLRRFASAKDRTIKDKLRYKSIRFRISWPGYDTWEGNVYVKQIGPMAAQFATEFRAFLANARTQRRAGTSLSAWNIQSQQFTVDDFALRAIVHCGLDIFSAEIEYIRRPRSKPRGRF